MGSRVLVLLRGSTLGLGQYGNCPGRSRSAFSQVLNLKRGRGFSASASASLPPPDVARLAETARISLAPNEVEEFEPKIRQVIEWFGQLQSVDLESVEPAIRADNEGENLRDDLPETFENREALLSAVPSFEAPYIKVPKVLNKE
ncbi:Glu-tRNAGln amidotransferase C subunit [Dillenia turbinata]|uniref:Glutamyl-tRNA(Gln) amidotransferase subunit C, chloroplastic/mitochondrial n=1 Tax=Dillenia turbinata TaxID=194707 RepID=A0AAN8U9A6_9MAGN